MQVKQFREGTCIVEGGGAQSYTKGIRCECGGHQLGDKCRRGTPFFNLPFDGGGGGGMDLCHFMIG